MRLYSSRTTPKTSSKPPPPSTANHPIFQDCVRMSCSIGSDCVHSSCSFAGHFGIIGGECGSIQGRIPWINMSAPRIGMGDITNKRTYESLTS